MASECKQACFFNGFLNIGCPSCWAHELKQLAMLQTHFKLEQQALHHELQGRQALQCPLQVSLWGASSWMQVMELDARPSLLAVWWLCLPTPCTLLKILAAHRWQQCKLYLAGWASFHMIVLAAFDVPDIDAITCLKGVGKLLHRHARCSMLAVSWTHIGCKAGFMVSLINVHQGLLILISKLCKPSHTLNITQVLRIICSFHTDAWRLAGTLQAPVINDWPQLAVPVGCPVMT